MMGLRHEVGGDWGNYEGTLGSVASLDFSDLITFRLPKGDPGFTLIEWLGGQWGGQYFINFSCSVIFCCGLVVFCRAQPRPWLALTVAVPYLIMVVGMGYSRQGVAVGFEMMGLVSLQNRRIKTFLVAIALAATFHKSAVVLIPLATLMRSHNRLFTMGLVGMVGLVLYQALLESSVDHLLRGYVEAQYQSSGAATRLAMNALPAGFFLIYRQQFDLTAEQRAFWTWMSLMAWGFVLALWVVPSSTAVDRVALYWIPLQLFVWSRMPDVLALGGSRSRTVSAIVLYTGVVHFTWLNFAEHSRYWLPYQFFPWVAFWK